MRDYQLRIFKPMELEPRGFTLVRRIAIVARDSDDAIAQAKKACLADVSVNDQAILFSADDIDFWMIHLG